MPIANFPSVLDVKNGRIQMSVGPPGKDIGLLVERDALFAGVLILLRKRKSLATFCSESPRRSKI